MNFGGCLIIVSHDRYFMDRLVEQLFVFEGDGFVKIFNGNYTDYREEAAEEEKQGNAKPNIANNSNKDKKETVQAKSNTDSKKLSFKEKQEYENLEKEIQDLEKRKSSLVEKLNSGNGSYQDLADWSAEIETITSNAEDKSMRWLELAEKM